MSPRPPPKISLKHKWKKELGSEHSQRPKIKQLSRSFQSNQPTLKPIRERSGRPDITHDVIVVQNGRKTSRSQEIDVIFFAKNLVLQSERDDLWSCMTWLICQTVLNYVLLMKAKRSKFKMKYFVKERKDPLLIMTWVMSQWCWTRRTWISEFQDCHIPSWSMRKVPTFENWFRKLRTIQIDMLFNKTHDKTNHIIFSVQNQNKWFRM